MHRSGSHRRADASAGLPALAHRRLATACPRGAGSPRHVGSVTPGIAASGAADSDAADSDAAASGAATSGAAGASWPAADEPAGGWVPLVDQSAERAATGGPEVRGASSPACADVGRRLPDRSTRLDRLADSVAERLPPSWRGGIARLSGRALSALGLIGLLAVLLGGCYYWLARPADEVAPPRRVLPVGASGPPTSATRSGAGSAVTAASTVAIPTPSAPGHVVVDVAGRVRHPGVVTLPTGARVNDALAAAGGPAGGADLSLVNLARPLVDGEQVVVPGVGERPAIVGPGGPGAGYGAGLGPGPSSGGSGSVAATGPVDLNSATLDQLDALPGVGPVLAQRILDWRQQHGRFATVDELREVDGIGERKFADLRARVRV